MLKQQLHALADAIKATSEYAQTAQCRKNVMDDADLGDRMRRFEKEHAAILRAPGPEAEIGARLRRLYADNAQFLAQPAVREYTGATQKYRQMILDSMRYLNELLDIAGGAPY